MAYLERYHGKARWVQYITHGGKRDKKVLMEFDDENIPIKEAMRLLHERLTPGEHYAYLKDMAERRFPGKTEDHVIAQGKGIKIEWKAGYDPKVYRATPEDIEEAEREFEEYYGKEGD